MPKQKTKVILTYSHVTQNKITRRNVFQSQSHLRLYKGWKCMRRIMGKLQYLLRYWKRKNVIEREEIFLFSLPSFLFLFLKCTITLRAKKISGAPVERQIERKRNALSLLQFLISVLSFFFLFSFLDSSNGNGRNQKWNLPLPALDFPETRKFRSVPWLWSF